MSPKIKLIAGLGNPGEEFKNSYHNVGFLALDLLAKNFSVKKFKKSRQSPFAYFKKNSLILLKPLTFMNESGKAIAAAAKFFKIKPEEILIIHDDSDIYLGDFKLSFNRGSAGHRGIESIIKYLKGKNFWRLRIGIRSAELQRKKAGEFVLSKMKKNEKKKIYSVLLKAVGEIENFIEKLTPSGED